MDMANLPACHVESHLRAFETATSRSHQDVVSDTPTNDFSELLAKAVHIGKPRYTYILQRAVFDAAYFTKTTCWSYEQERRMVVADSYVREAGPLVLLDVPRSCITNIICGSKASVETKAALTKLAKEINCGYFELRIGKSSAIPYLAHNDGQSFFFDGVEIVPSHQHCETCQEPAALVDEQCSWCRIDERLRQYVASRNPFRILDHIGLLGSYIESMDAISGGRPRRKSDD